MKRLLLIFCAILILASLLAGCGEPEHVHVHEFGEWTVTKAATCTEAGEQKRVCDCGEEETEVIEILPHSWAEATCYVAKTCKTCGITEGKPLGHDGKIGENCSRCGEKIEFTVVIPELPLEVWMEQDNVTRIDSVTYTVEGDEITFNVNMTKLNELKGNAYNGFIYRLYDREDKLLTENPVTRMDSLIGTAYDVSWNVNTSELGLSPETTMVFLELRDFVWEEE